MFRSGLNEFYHVFFLKITRVCKKWLHFHCHVFMFLMSFIAEFSELYRVVPSFTELYQVLPRIFQFSYVLLVLDGIFSG